MVNKKVHAALAAGLTPSSVSARPWSSGNKGSPGGLPPATGRALAGLTAGAAARLIIAYEPVWAIGTGRTATPQDAQSVIGYVRAWLREAYGDTADTVRILYGGSVKASNIDGLMAQPDIDGALVGGASLDAGNLPALSGSRFRTDEPPRFVVLVILDGWGLGPDSGNAIRAARTPNIDRLQSLFPAAALQASGTDVGLPPGQMGNSEVGHLNIGAGRVVYQDLTRISKAIEEGTFFTNPRLVEAMAAVPPGGALHLLGLLSDGGVYSSLDHIEALLRMAKQQGVPRVYLHPFLDGCDVPPKSALGYLEWLEEACRRIGVGTIATVGGRYYAMDRDKRWIALPRLTPPWFKGRGPWVPWHARAVEGFLRPGRHRRVCPARRRRAPVVPLGPGDSVIAFNFRPIACGK